MDNLPDNRMEIDSNTEKNLPGGIAVSGEELLGSHNEIQPGPKQAAVYGKRGPGWFATVLLCALFSLLSVFVYDRYFALKLVAVDIKGYLADQRDMYVAHKINEEQLNQAIDRLGAAVDRIPKNRAVVMADAVIRNVEVVKP